MRIRFIDAEKGKNSNWVKIYAYVASIDINRKFEFDFCGTELQSSCTMTDEQNETMKELLCDRIGYAPFDIKNVKKYINRSATIDLDTKEWL